MIRTVANKAWERKERRIDRNGWAGWEECTIVGRNENGFLSPTVLHLRKETTIKKEEWRK